MKKLLSSLMLGIILVGCSASNNPTNPNQVPTATPTPSSMAVTISASVTVTGGVLEILDYNPNSSLNQDVTITGIAVAPSQTVTVMNFGTGHDVYMILTQNQVTCPGSGLWGTYLSVQQQKIIDGSMQSLTSQGTSTTYCGQGLGYMQMQAQIYSVVGTSLTKIW